MNDWNYKDSIDLEFFLKGDERLKDDELRTRDRNIFLCQAKRTPDDNEPPPFELLKTWLRARRNELEIQELPGNIAGETLTILKTVLTLSGLAAGAGSGLAYLSYSGTTPVNVLPFFALFVVVQLLLTILLLTKHLIATLLKNGLPNSITVTLLAGRAEKTALTLLKKVRQRATSGTRLDVDRFMGQGRAFFRVHSKTLFWPLFSTLQLTAVTFNLGLIFAMFFKISVTDVAFGWQTTLQLGAASLHRFVEWIALPWSPLFSQGTGYPTLEQVEGSRIILKEGIAGLASNDLTSWWPFLLLSVTCYSLLPRLGLLLYGKFKEKQVGSSPFILTPAAENIIRRMCTPLVSSQAKPDSDKSKQPPETAPETPQPAAAGHVEKTVALFLPDDCFDESIEPALRALIQQSGFLPGQLYRYQVDYDSDMELLEKFSKSVITNGTGVILLAESWMPPLMDFLTFVRELRKRTSPSFPIRIVLLGRPNENTPLTPVDDENHMAVWKKKIETLGDPYVDIASFPGEVSHG